MLHGFDISASFGKFAKQVVSCSPRVVLYPVRPSGFHPGGLYAVAFGTPPPYL